jgi:hypothetical protein
MKAPTTRLVSLSSVLCTAARMSSRSLFLSTRDTISAHTNDDVCWSLWALLLGRESEGYCTDQQPPAKSGLRHVRAQVTHQSGVYARAVHVNDDQSRILSGQSPHPECVREYERMCQYVELLDYARARVHTRRPQTERTAARSAVRRPA